MQSNLGSLVPQWCELTYYFFYTYCILDSVRLIVNKLFPILKGSLKICATFTFTFFFFFFFFCHKNDEFYFYWYGKSKLLFIYVYILYIYIYIIHFGPLSSPLVTVSKTKSSYDTVKLLFLQNRTYIPSQKVTNSCVFFFLLAGYFFFSAFFYE